jgi:hypothetical protein
VVSFTYTFLTVVCARDTFFGFLVLKESSFAVAILFNVSVWSTRNTVGWCLFTEFAFWITNDYLSRSYWDVFNDHGFWCWWFWNTFWWFNESFFTDDTVIAFIDTSFTFSTTFFAVFLSFDLEESIFTWTLWWVLFSVSCAISTVVWFSNTFFAFRVTYLTVFL